MKYCAFLRGVNVKGTAMKMAEVCNVFKKLGLNNVSSVLATGNIIFESEEKPKILKETLEKELSKHFDYEAFLFLKTNEEVSMIFNKNPFTKDENLHNYVFISKENATNILMEEFKKSRKTENEDAKMVDNTLYWKVEKGNTLNSEFGKILGKKSLKDQFTSRNINTIEKIINKFN